MKVVLSSNRIQEPPVRLDGLNAVVVEDNFGNPIFVAVQQTEENIWSITPDDPKFESIVKSLGITKRVAVTVDTLM